MRLDSTRSDSKEHVSERSGPGVEPSQRGVATPD